MRSYGCLGRDRQRNRGFFSGMLRGVSNPREGSKILTFLFGPRLVCSSLLHLLSSWKVNTANYFALCAFSEVMHSPGPMRQGFLCSIGGSRLYVHRTLIIPAGRICGSSVGQGHKTGLMWLLRPPLRGLPPSLRTSLLTRKEFLRTTKIPRKRCSRPQDSLRIHRSLVIRQEERV